MNFKALHQEIEKRLMQGQEREDIFSELCSTVSQGEERKIAFAVACVPEQSFKKEMLKFNHALMLLLIVYAILVGATSFPMKEGASLLWTFCDCILPLAFAYLTYLFYGAVYRIAAVWILFDLLETAVLSLSQPLSFVLIAKLILVFSCMSLSWYIARKVFPHLGFLGVRQNAQGSYMI